MKTLFYLIVLLAIAVYSNPALAQDKIYGGAEANFDIQLGGTLLIGNPEEVEVISGQTVATEVFLTTYESTWLGQFGIGVAYEASVFVADGTFEATSDDDAAFVQTDAPLRNNRLQFQRIGIPIRYQLLMARDDKKPKGAYLA